ncbi:hypothetical protein BDR26DRAFT_906439 [Obelidium mucronatum]|nr:hypothetical protein BDR26DRAFT_906439 [Obelidium mucronatum]
MQPTSPQFNHPLQSAPAPIRKEDISAPLPPAELLLIKAEPIAQLQQRTVSPTNSSPQTTISRSGHPRPLSASASAVGGPSEFGGSSAIAFKSYQNFVTTLGMYRRQIASMAIVSEQFVRACEELEVQFVNLDSHPDLQNSARIRDLHALIDSTHLVANTHQRWGETLGQDIEEPITKHMNDIMATVKTRQTKNSARINELAKRLTAEEEESYRLGKKKQRDLVSLQDSLGLRVTLTDEIRRLTVENSKMEDVLATNSVDLLLNSFSGVVYTQMEAYDGILDGLKKIDLFESGDYERNKVATKEAILKHINPPPTSSSPIPPVPAPPASTAFHPPPRTEKSHKPIVAVTNKPDYVDVNAPPSILPQEAYEDDILPIDSISNVAPQESVLGESARTTQMMNTPPPTPPQMAKTKSKGMRLFGGGR